MKNNACTQPADMNFDELRAERAIARRQLELASMRLPAHDEKSEEALRPLRERARSLTEELIDRYSRDLSLVDLLLASPYPAHESVSSSAVVNAPEVRS